MQRTTTNAPAARTRTRTRRQRDPYAEAAAPARNAIEKLGRLSPKGPGPAMVLMAIIHQTALYSWRAKDVSVARLVEITNLDRRTVQRALRYLSKNGVIERVTLPPEQGSKTPRPIIGWPSEPPVENVPGGGAPDAHRGGAPDAPTRSNEEKEKEVVWGSDTFRSARESGRPEGRPHAPRQFPQVTPTPPVNRWPSEPVPDPAREAERREIAAEIERRRRLREVAS